MIAPRIVLDTNVVISAILFGGTPATIIKKIIRGEVQGFTSLFILDEILDVLQRPKFGLTPKQAFSIVEDYQDLCELVGPTIQVQAVPDDPDDNRILECAQESSAQYIITGDNHLLKIRKWEDIPILSASEFLLQFP